MTEEEFRKEARELKDALRENTKQTSRLSTAVEALVSIMFQIKQSEGSAAMLGNFARSVGSAALRKILDKIR